MSRLAAAPALLMLLASASAALPTITSLTPRGVKLGEVFPLGGRRGQTVEYVLRGGSLVGEVRRRQRLEYGLEEEKYNCQTPWNCLAGHRLPLEEGADLSLTKRPSV